MRVCLYTLALGKCIHLTEAEISSDIAQTAAGQRLWSKDGILSVFA